VSPAVHPELMGLSAEELANVARHNITLSKWVLAYQLTDAPVPGSCKAATADRWSCDYSIPQYAPNHTHTYNQQQL